MRKPLYLGHAARRVRLDGAALCVDVEGRAPARVPLRRLSRVVAHRGAEWSTAALVTCLEAGVPVAFLRFDGMPAGVCLPAVARGSEPLARRLDRLERSPHGRAAFANWAAAEERRAILRLLGRPMVASAVDLRPERVRAAVLADLPVSPAAGEAMLRRLEGMLAAELPELLLRAGLPTFRAASVPAGRLDLFGACLAAARWELVPALRRAAAHRRAHPRKWTAPAQRAQRLARQYEALAPRIAAQTHRRLQRLDHWLWEREREP